MSAPRGAMRKIKEWLRLKLECGLSLERAALSALDESEIAARLFASVNRVRGHRALIELATMHFELRRKGITLFLSWREYQQANAKPPTYQDTQFCQYSTTVTTLPRRGSRCARCIAPARSCYQLRRPDRAVGQPG